MNCYFGKIENGELKYAPDIIKVGEYTEIINPKESHYLQNGYKTIVREQGEFEEGYHFEENGFEETQTQIKILYKKVKDEEINEE